MSAEPQSKATLDVLLSAVNAPHALVILVDEHGEIESADKNLGLQNVMLVCFSLAYEISQRLKAEAPQGNGSWPSCSPCPLVTLSAASLTTPSSTIRTVLVFGYARVVLRASRKSGFSSTIPTVTITGPSISRSNRPSDWSWPCRSGSRVPSDERVSVPWHESNRPLGGRVYMLRL